MPAIDPAAGLDILAPAAPAQDGPPVQRPSPDRLLSESPAPAERPSAAMRTAAPMRLAGERPPSTFLFLNQERILTDSRTGRALLADPGWVNRLRSGTLDAFNGYDPATALATLH